MITVTKLFHSKKTQVAVASNPGNFTRVAARVRETAGNGTFIVFLAFLLFIFDVLIDYRGFNITDLGEISGLIKFGKSLIFLVMLSVFFYFLASKDRSPRAVVSFAFGAVIVKITLIFLFALDPAPIYHFVYIMIFWALFVRQREDAATANWILVVVMFFDLYFLSLVNMLYPALSVWLEGIPFLFFLTLGYVYEQTNNKLAIVFIFLIVVWYFFTSGPAFAAGLRSAGVVVAPTELPSSPSEWLSAAKERLWDKPISKISRGGEAWLSSRVQYAITGKIEQNQHEQLGVYLENVKSADSKYYEGEDVVIWGTVKARTLDDPVNVELGCFVKKDDKEIKAESDPDAPFPVFTLEENDFACTFDKVKFKDIFKSGANSVTTFASFNFETLSSLKVYFIDRERLRANVRQAEIENIDVYDKLKIKDKKPVSLSTNGPVEIGMETTSPLVGVSTSYISFPRLSFSVQRNKGWDGKITALKELVMLLPKGVEITNPAFDCGERKFVRYDVDDCKKSCSSVKGDCENVCGGYLGSDVERCKDRCLEQSNKCEEECGFLFDGLQHTGYALDKNDLDEINKKLERDDTSTSFEFFRCNLNPKPSEVLDENFEFTTKTITAKARYNYRVEKSVTFSMQKDTADERTRKIGDIALKAGDELRNLIIKTSNENSVDPAVIMAIASIESSLRHCCSSSSAVTGDACSGTTVISCPADRTLKGDGGKSIGLMQINIDQHPKWAVPTTDHGCDGKTAYDLECNIKLGIGLYKKHLTDYGNTEVYNAKVESGPCSDPVRKAKYLAYTDSQRRALRAYNGFGCATDKIADYVDDVQAAYNEIKEKKILLEKVEPPSNVHASDFSDFDRPAIRLTWDKSKSLDIEGYTIKRYSDATSDVATITVGNGAEYLDPNVDYGNAYWYRISTRSVSYTSEEVLSNTVGINDKTAYGSTFG